MSSSGSAPEKPPHATRHPFEELLDHASGLAVVGFARGGGITRFSRGAERLFGYRAENLLGTATYEVLHAKEDLDRHFGSAALAEVSGSNVQFDAITRTRDLVPVEAVFQHVPGGMEDGTELLVLYRDRSALARVAQETEELSRMIRQEGSHSEREAEFLRELLRHTVENVQIALSVHELHSGMITYTNETFQELTGVPHPDVIGMTLEEVVKKYPETSERLCGYFERLRASASGRGEKPAPAHWELELPAGKRVVEVYGRLIAVEGHANQFILLIIEDNTERQRLQMQLVQSEKLAAMGQLAAGIAHEIRNPLATIYNALFDLDEIVENRSAEVADDINIAMEEIRRVQDIINNLLDFARESERSSGSADVNDVLRKTIRLVQHDLTGKNIQVKWELGDVGEVAISNNALKQILINLLTNAAQAMSSGGTLSLRTTVRPGLVPCRSNNPMTVKKSGGTARLRLGPGGSGERPAVQEKYGAHVRLEIEDTGPGVPPDVMSNIFNPFFTTKPPGSGTGLGLSVVHSLVEDCGGAVSVRSHPGEGTVFSIELPCYGSGMEEE